MWLPLRKECRLARERRLAMVMSLALQRTILNLGLAIWALSRLSRGLAMGLRLATKNPILNLGLAVLAVLPI